MLLRTEIRPPCASSVEFRRHAISDLWQEHPRLLADFRPGDKVCPPETTTPRAPRAFSTDPSTSSPPSTQSNSASRTAWMTARSLSHFHPGLDALAGKGLRSCRVDASSVCRPAGMAKPLVARPSTAPLPSGHRVARVRICCDTRCSGFEDRHSHGIYGSRRVHAELRLGRAWSGTARWSC